MEILIIIRAQCGVGILRKQREAFGSKPAFFLCLSSEESTCTFLPTVQAAVAQKFVRGGLFFLSPSCPMCLLQ